MFDFNGRVSFAYMKLAKNKVIADTEAGTIILKDRKTISNWIKSSPIHILYAEKNILPSLMCLALGLVERMRFTETGKIGIDGYVMSADKASHAFSFSKAHDTHRIIQYGWQTDINTVQELITSYNTLKALKEKYPKIIIADNLSPEASGRETYAKLTDEPRLTKLWLPELLDAANKAVYGCTFVTSFIGSKEYSVDEDIISCHPTFSKLQKRITDNSYIKTTPLALDPKEDYGLYKIETTIPNAYLFPPLPVKEPIINPNKFGRQDCITFPVGYIPPDDKNWYNKSFVQQLDDLKIPYKVIEAKHIYCISNDYNQKDFADLAIAISNDKEFDNLLVKKFLYSGYGSLAMNGCTYENPLKYGDLYAREHARTTLELNRYSFDQQHGRFHDGWQIGKNLQLCNIAKVKGEGPTLFINPAIKDKPGINDYRNYIAKHPNDKNIKLSYVRYPTLYEIAFGYEDIVSWIASEEVKPSTGIRKSSKTVQRIGDLLENSYITEPGTIDDYAKIIAIEDNISWLKQMKQSEI